MKYLLRIKNINDFLKKRAFDSSNQITAFGIILTINYPLYYFIWLYADQQSYENLPLRLCASLFCFLLAINKFWPTTLKSFLPIYWYFTATFCLPFFFTFMLLKNNASTIWLMNSVSIVFFLLLLFDLLSATILLGIGIIFGILFYQLTTPWKFIIQPGIINISGVLCTLIAAFLIGAVFARNKEKLEKEKLKTIRALSTSIAHELRTPLATIKANAEGIKEYLPDLLKSYELAKQNNVNVPDIRPSQFVNLNAAVEHIQAETNFSNIIINLMLTNVDHSSIETTKFTACSIADCITETLARYPLLPNEKSLINWNNNTDFAFNGDKLLTIHVLFNLLKNALFYLKAANKGDIQIWIEKKDKYNNLHFRDSGTGIASNTLPHIFEHFFTQTYHGTGVGLSFCKMVMRTYGGDIICQSVEGEFTEFVLSFPILK